MVLFESAQSHRDHCRIADRFCHIDWDLHCANECVVSWEAQVVFGHFSASAFFITTKYSFYHHKSDYNMSDVAIRVENLGKRYRIGKAQVRHDTLRDALMASARAPLQWFSSNGNRTAEYEWIWALKDVSFEIKRGEIVGVIGRNGAGKSTLLKILSRITEPTEGYADIYGRVGTLLEVGTGFHPELTGRENIYLSGAILGMRRAEIDRKFDEIVAFAEIEKFIDTPVKHYSSGMYVRLAFAVAAHLEPEILLVDEVLAVGDAAFQKKCLGKIGDVAREGRTVVFVSHNMGAIAQLCLISLYMQDGQLRAMESADKVIAKYLTEGGRELREINIDSSSNPKSPIIITRCWIGDENGKPIPVVQTTKTFSVGVQVLVRQELPNVDIGIRVCNALGQPVFNSNLSDTLGRQANFKPGTNAFLFQIPADFLAPDTYTLTFALHRPTMQLFDLREHVLNFRIEESGSNMWQYSGHHYGNILVKFPWRIIQGEIG